MIIGSQGSFGYTAALMNGHCALYIANEPSKFDLPLAKEMVVID